MKPWLKIALGIGIGMCCMPVFAADLAWLQNGFSIRHDHREVIGSVTRLYTGKDNTNFVDVPTFQILRFEPDPTPDPPAASPVAAPEIHAVPMSASSPAGTQSPAVRSPALSDVIASASDRHNVDPALISSVIHAESDFNPHAVSPKGARGLMQLMPKTAADLGVANSFDPTANVEGGTRYLRELLEYYNFDLVKALAAYNAGTLRVKQYRGVPPYYETHAYVAKIIREFNRKKLAEQKAEALAAKGKKQAPQKNLPSDSPVSVSQSHPQIPASNAAR